MDKIILFSKVEGDKVKFGIEHIGKIPVISRGDTFEVKSMGEILKDGSRKWEVQEVFYYYMPWYENEAFDFTAEWKRLDDMMEQVIETVREARKALEEVTEKYNEQQQYSF